MKSTRSAATAVAAVLCADGEVLVVQRAVHLNAFPGYASFPGGRVESDEPPPPGAPAFCGLPAEHMAALRRELIEEIALDIDAEARRGNLRRCVSIGQATTPPGQPRRFATHFYRIDLAHKPDLTVDPSELDSAAWTRATDALDAWARGERLMVPPTRQVLAGLARDFDSCEVGDLNAHHDPVPGLHMVEIIAGLPTIAVPSNTLPPASATNAFVIGDAGGERILVDPSPRSQEVFDRLLLTVEPLGLSAIFITHHHPDHRERADALARRLQLPLLMSADTRARIPTRGGAGFFDQLRVREIGDGEEVCRWQGQPVRALSVPGHDAGQLALAPDSGHWMVVGDLFQGVGTVVIAAPEGDMAAYFRSLQRVIDLDPRAVIPSHGIPMGSTFRIRATLEHRRMREAEILRLHGAGHSIEEMLPVIYAGIPDALLPLARMNIESHLAKLAAEQRLTA